MSRAVRWWMAALSCLAALAGLVVSPAAVADDYVPASDVPEVAPWMALAEATWPGNPCAGRETVRIADLPPGTGGQAHTDGSCRFDLATSMAMLSTPTGVCATVVHEVGHLAGMGHSQDPFDVMYGDGSDMRHLWWPPCAVAAGQQTLAAAVALAIPGIRPGVCTSQRAVVICKAEVYRHAVRGWRPALYEVEPAGEHWVLHRLRLRRRHGS